jgi:hypothetical protein
LSRLRGGLLSALLLARLLIALPLLGILIRIRHLKYLIGLMQPCAAGYEFCDYKP